MNAADLLARLHKLDIRVSLREGRLNVSAPKGALTDELRQQLAEHREALIEYLRSAETLALDSPPLAIVSREDPIPVSPAQQQLWALMQLRPDSAAYNMHLAYRLHGPLDIEALRRAVADLAARHESTRTRFIESSRGEVHAVIDPPESVRLAVLPKNTIPLHDRETIAQQAATEEARRPFNLKEGPLFRASLLPFAKDDHIFLITMHHVISDGHSFDLLLTDLAAAYHARVGGQPPNFLEKKFDYADFAAWQRSWLESPAGAAQRGFWAAALTGGIQAPALPADRTAADLPDGAHFHFPLPPEASARLLELGRAQGATRFQVLLAAFSVWLSGLTGQQDFLVATPVAGRTREAFMQVVGFFNNTLLLPCRIDRSRSFREHIDSIRVMSTSALANQDFPFAETVRLNDLRQVPLSRAMFALQGNPMPPLELSGINAELLAVDSGTVQYDLSLTITETGGALEADFGYKTGRFEPATVRAYIDQFTGLLESLAEAPDDPLTGWDLDAPARTVRAAPEQKAPFIPPGTDLERRLARIWEDVLAYKPVGSNQDFFTLGGHSLLALRMFTRIREQLGLHLPLATLFEGRTVFEIARIIERGGAEGEWRSLVPIQPQGDRPPFYCIHGLTGDILWFRRLGELMRPSGIPFYGLQARGLDGIQQPHDDIAAMAAQYVGELVEFQPRGPYFLGGASLGGTIALEMARQMLADGREVALLVMFDHAPQAEVSRRTRSGGLTPLFRLVRNVPRWGEAALETGAGDLLLRFRRKTRTGWNALVRRLARSNQRAADSADLLDYGEEMPEHRQRIIEAHWRAIRRYPAAPYPGRVLLLQARAQPLLSLAPPDLGWKQLARGLLDVVVVPGSHEGMFHDPHVETLAHTLQRYLNE